MSLKDRIISYGKSHPKSRYLVIGSLVVVIFADNMKKQFLSFVSKKQKKTEAESLNTDIRTFEAEYEEIQRIFHNIRNVEYNQEQTKEQFRSMNHLVYLPLVLICAFAIGGITLADSLSMPKIVNANSLQNEVPEETSEQAVYKTKETTETFLAVQEETLVTAEIPEEVVIDNDRLPWYLMLVNDDYTVPEDYEVELVYVDGKQVDKRIEESLREMLAAAKKAGMRCKICSGYRTAAKQQKLIDKDVAKYKAMGYSEEEALEFTYQGVAPVNSSEHQTGMAVDIVSSSHQRLDAAHANTKEAIWLKDHCKEFGFIVRYMEGKEDITHRKAESWHFRYVGVEAATEIMEQEITLEEYLEEYIKEN